MSKQIDVTEPDSETLSSEKSKRFTVYKVLIELPDGRSYFIFRRYNEFHQMCDKFKKLHPDLHIKLPGEKLLGNNFDPEFIKIQREGLNDANVISKPIGVTVPDSETMSSEKSKRFTKENSLGPRKDPRGIPQQEHFPANAISKQIDVTVPDSETLSSEKSKRFTIYKVLIKLPDGRCYFIFRRYNEFHQMCDKLKKLYPDLHIKLPGKRFLGSNFDPEFIKIRREGLNDAVQKIMSHPKAIDHPVVREFFVLDNDDDQPEADEFDSQGRYMDGIDLGGTNNPRAKPSDFFFLKIIGKGSFGKVFLSKNKAEEKFYAIKVLNKAAIRKRNEAKHIMAERNVLLQNVKHPFLVGLHYSFQTRDKLYFVLDYVNGGELFFHLQRERYFPESRARFYAAEIASAIGYLHALSIIYRDLKPENILLDFRGHIVLTDFGLCKEGIELDGTTSTFCGTPEYLAPEVLRKQEYDKTVDWWCLGAVLYEMMYGLPPFYSRNTAEMYDNILNKPLRLRENISPSARHILEGLLQKDRTKRFGRGEYDFEEIKCHPFFKTIDWRLLYEKKIDPPYNPNVSSQLDLKHFDPEFVREPVPGSVGLSADSAYTSASVDDPDDAFVGFTYVPPEDIE